MVGYIDVFDTEGISFFMKYAETQTYSFIHIDRNACFILRYAERREQIFSEVAPNYINYI